MTLDITYSGSCADLQGWGVALIVGNDPQATETRVQSDFFTSTTDTCENGHVGTLVVTPSDASPRGSVIVIAGLGRKPQECDPSNGYFGCVVARRSFSFADHTRLVMPILLDPSCKNVPCDAVSSCKSGACVSSEARCEGERCDDFGVTSDGGSLYVDAPTSSDQVAPPLLDGAVPLPDGAIFDARVDAPETGPPGTCAKQPMECPAGVSCNFGDTCCIRPPKGPDGGPSNRTKSCSTIYGACGNPYEDMAIGGYSLGCRGARNCTGSDWCCAPPAPVTSCGSTCMFGGPGTPPSIVCQLDCECPADMFCDTSTPYFGDLFKCKPR